MARKSGVVVCLTAVLAWGLGAAGPGPTRGDPERPCRVPARPAPGLRQPGRSNSRAIPTITPARSPSATWATSGPPTRTAPASSALTDNIAREVYPALLAGRPLDRVLVESLRQQRRVRHARDRRHAASSSRSTPAATTSSAGRAMDSRCCSDRRTATARSRTSRRCTRCRSPAARSSRCRWTGATTATTRPTASSSSSTGIPGTWTRKHYRGSLGRDLWIADLGTKTYRQLLADERYNRFWPMWGADNHIYYVADPLPNDKTVQAGSLEVCKSANNIYRIPRGRRPAGAGHEAHERQPVLAVDVRRRQDDRLRRELRRLEARRRVRPHDARSRSRSRPTTRRTSSKSRRFRTKSTRSICRRPASAR